MSTWIRSFKLVVVEPTLYRRERKGKKEMVILFSSEIRELEIELEIELERA